MNSLLKISETILSERKKQKWSQQLLADYAGLNKMTIGKIERILNLFNKSLMVTDSRLPTLDQLKETNNG